MNNFAIRISLIGASLLLVACATSPISTSQAKPVPADRLILSTFSQPGPSTGEVIVKRDSGIGGSACSSKVFLDAKPVADLLTGEKVTLYLPEGEYLLGAFPNGICGGGLSETRASVKPNQTLLFRIGYGSNGDFYIQPTAF